ICLSNSVRYVCFSSPLSLNRACLGLQSLNGLPRVSRAGSNPDTQIAALLAILPAYHLDLPQRLAVFTLLNLFNLRGPDFIRQMDSYVVIGHLTRLFERDVFRTRPAFKDCPQFFDDMMWLERFAIVLQDHVVNSETGFNAQVTRELPGIVALDADGALRAAKHFGPLT